MQKGPNLGEIMMIWSIKGLPTIIELVFTEVLMTCGTVRPTSTA